MASLKKLKITRLVVQDFSELSMGYIMIIIGFIVAAAVEKHENDRQSLWIFLPVTLAGQLHVFDNRWSLRLFTRLS